MARGTSYLQLLPPILLLLLFQAKLVQVYHLHDHKHGLMLHLQLQFPHRLVQLAGAPAAAWVVLHSPPNEQQLFLTVAWQNKTVTRLPEALWLRFQPGAGAVDERSWKIFKMDSYIQPHEVRCAVGDKGVGSAIL